MGPVRRKERVEADEQRDSSGGGSGNCNLTQLMGPDGAEEEREPPGQGVPSALRSGAGGALLFTRRGPGAVVTCSAQPRVHLKASLCRPMSWWGAQTPSETAVTCPWGVPLHARVEDSDLPRPRPTGPCTLAIMERQGAFVGVTVLLSWLPGGSVIKNRLQCRRLKFGPWVGKIPWRRKWQPTPAFLPGESPGLRSLAGYSP